MSRQNMEFQALQYSLLGFLLIIFLLCLFSIRSPGLALRVGTKFLHSQSKYKHTINSCHSIVVMSVTEQDPMGSFQNRPPPKSSACLLSVEKLYSQRINLIREVRKCIKKGKQSSKTK